MIYILARHNKPMSYTDKYWYNKGTFHHRINCDNKHISEQVLHATAK
jgi:hypothetical protein